MSAERRRHRRIRLRTPIRGSVGASRVYVMDGSVDGIGIAHEGALPPPGSICRIDLASDWGLIRVDCEVIRTVANRVEQTQTHTRKPVYRSGVRIVVMDHQSAQRLETMIESVAHDDY